MSRLSARDKRLQIQTLLKTNSSVEEICRLSGASRDTVWRVRTGRVGVSRKRGSGRPRKHCAAVDQSVLRYLKAQRVGSVRRAAVGLRAEGVADLSKSTIHRIAKRFDWHSSRPRKRAKLTPKQKTDRLAFAQRLLAEHPEADKWWQSIVCSDEKSGQLDGCSARVWRRPGVAPPPQLHEKYAPKLMFWGAICSTKTAPLQALGKGDSMNAQRYIRVLSEWLGGVFPAREVISITEPTLVLMQDGAPCHRAGATKLWIEQQSAFVTLLDAWPANSPDLNPIENLWAFTNQQLSNTAFHDLDDLHAAVDAAWGAIDQEMVRRFTGSFRARLQAVIAANGGLTRY